MNAIKATRRTVMANPTGEDSRILTRFVLALGNETPFASCDLCDLELETFERAPQILVEWRRDKSCASKVKLFDLSVQADALASGFATGRAGSGFLRLSATSLDTSFVITPAAR